MTARFRTSDDDHEPDTEPDTNPSGERRDTGYSDADRTAMADREAARWEDAFWGPGL